MDTFSDWLIAQMKVRDWSQSDLARASGLTRQAIGRYLAEKTKTPDEFALQKIAHAFELPPETVYRAAGILPSKPADDEEIEEIMYEVRHMNKADRPELLAYIRMKNNLRKKK
jgi:transcriptional regulator with XRE-family HTH domain